MRSPSVGEVEGPSLCCQEAVDHANAVHRHANLCRQMPQRLDDLVKTHKGDRLPKRNFMLTIRCAIFREMQTGASLIGGVRFVLRTRKIYMPFSKEEEVYSARFRALFATIVLSVPHRVAHVITIAAVISCAVDLVSFSAISVIFFVPSVMFRNPVSP